MLKYVVILLDKTSAAYCHADNPFNERQLIPLQTLKDAIFWAMKENLMIQFVYPDYQLPEEYEKVIDSIDHIDIGHHTNDDIIILDCVKRNANINNKNVVLRTTLRQLLDKKDDVVDLLKRVAHLSIIITDIELIGEADFTAYKQWLEDISADVEDIYLSGCSPQFNLITDRMVIDNMNNCNAGWESITIAPNGKLYICPAFYYSDENDCVGSLVDGIDIKNPHLYQLNHAPICRICDAYQCHRCIWLNKKLTREVNTPSHQQCVLAHIERNASRDLLTRLRKYGEFLPEKEIKEIDYLDPFDKIINK